MLHGLDYKHPTCVCVRVGPDNFQEKNVTLFGQNWSGQMSYPCPSVECPTQVHEEKRKVHLTELIITNLKLPFF